MVTLHASISSHLTTHRETLFRSHPSGRSTDVELDERTRILGHEAFTTITILPISHW